MNNMDQEINSALHLLLSRRSVKAVEMTEPGPDHQQLKTIIRAGMRVPDHGKIGPWRIQILDKAGQAVLGDKLADIFATDNPNCPPSSIEAERNRSQRAPVLLIIAFVPDEMKYFKAPRSEQLLSCGAMCQNILLAAHAMGYVGQWLTEWPSYHPEVRQALGYSAETELVGFLYLGTAKDKPDERPRPDYDKVVSQWP